MKNEQSGLEIIEIKLVQNVREDYPDGKGYSFSQAYMQVTLPMNCSIDEAIEILMNLKEGATR